MDNRSIDITSEGYASLERAIELVWGNAHSGEATHFKIVKLREKTEYQNSEQTNPSDD